MVSYLARIPFATRWSDNDQYGHLNNAVYYQAMDTAVNAWMIAEAGLDPRGDAPIALCVSSSCEFRESASFPEPLEVGVGVSRLGRSSITWSLAILRTGGDAPIAVGEFVHVFVDPVTRRPVPIPDAVRSAVAGDLPEGPAPA